MSEFTIEEDIPIPDAHRGLGVSPKYPFREMNIGDSFFVPDMKANELSARATYYGKSLNMKFTVRAVEGGARIWRTK